MRTPLTLLLWVLLAALSSHGQGTNEIFKMRGTVVATRALTGLTFANPHRYVRIDPPDLSITVRVESVEPALTNHLKGSLATFSSLVQSNFFPGDAARGATYDFVLSRKAGRSASASEQFELKAPPKLVSQPDGSANRSQPVSPGTNSTSLPAGSGR